MASRVQPLTGEEIIVDLLETIAERLRANCNLRASDSYSRGYSAKVELNIECYGLDMAKVETQVVIGDQQDDVDLELVKEKIDIPLEENLNTVRERSGQEDGPTLQIGEPQQPQKRRYARRIPGAAAQTEERF